MHALKINFVRLYFCLTQIFKSFNYLKIFQNHLISISDCNLIYKYSDFTYFLDRSIVLNLCFLKSVYI